MKTYAERTAELHAQLGTPERLAALAQYDLGNPELRQQLDQLAETTAARLGSPTSIVSFVLDTALVLGGEWGLAEESFVKQAGGSPAEWAVCAEVVTSRLPVISGNLLEKESQADNPLVAYGQLRSYAGVPLTVDNDVVLGASCVLSSEERAFSDEDIAHLHASAEEAMSILRRFPIQSSPGQQPI